LSMTMVRLSVRGFAGRSGIKGRFVFMEYKVNVKGVSEKHNIFKISGYCSFRAAFLSFC